MMDRNKVLDKIQKCMALSKSPNEHEAAAAMRQAQKLMERHGVTETELGVIGYAAEVVHCSIQAGKKIPHTLQSVTALMMRAFGVYAVYGSEVRVSDRSFTVTYLGPQHRVLLAAYAHDVVSRAVDRAWAKHLKENPRYKGVTGARAGFYLGWVSAVRDKVEAFGIQDDEQRAIDALSKSMYGDLNEAKANKQRVYTNTMKAGAMAGESFDLHRPVGTSPSAVPQPLRIGV